MGSVAIRYFRIPATAGATKLLLVTFLIPVSAIMLSRRKGTMTSVAVTLLGPDLYRLDEALPGFPCCRY